MNKVNNITAQVIEQLLQEAINPTYIKVEDQAHLHTSHKNAGAGHFALYIESPSFMKKSKIEIHRTIYAVLNPFLNNGIHALAIHAKCPNGE